MCSEYLHWPWSPDECVADVKATFQTTYIYECIPDNPNPIDDGTPGSGTGSGSGGGDGSSNGSTAPSLTSIISTQPLECPIPPPGDMDFDCNVDEDEANYLAFINSLSVEQKLYLKNNRPVKYGVFDYLDGEAFNEEAKEFAEELISLAIVETNQQDVNRLMNLTLLIEKSGNTLFTEEFATTLKPYLDPSFSHIPPDFPLSSLTIKTFLDYKNLRQLNPEWSRAKCIWHATKDLVHLGLDVFGLIPVGGEIADLANGALYIIEGDNLNANLSLASAVPIAGWATASVKFAIRIKDVSQTAYTVSTKVKLVWKNVAGNILFGDRRQLRKVLGMGPTAADARQAHHIIPWGKLGHPAVQKAAKSGNAFHMNEALNGIPLDTAVHSGSHGHYDGLVQTYLDAIPANATPDFCYNKIMEIISKVRVAIQNNPGVPINQLNF